MAFPVAVKMIFALFRKEFNGPPKALAPLNGAVEPCIGHGDVKKAGLPAKFGGRVGVRVGDELKGIKADSLRFMAGSEDSPVSRA